jgi:hypothetical protein
MATQTHPRSHLIDDSTAAPCSLVSQNFIYEDQFLISHSGPTKKPLEKGVASAHANTQCKPYLILHVLHLQVL